MSEEVKEALDATFERDVLAVTGKPVLVEFWADWCAPCKLQQPVVAELPSHYGDGLSIARLDVEANPETTQRYGIKGIPTLIVFRDGKEVERVVGVVNRDAAIKMIDKYIGAAVAESAEQ